MENKINRQTKNEEIDRLLEEQYYAETKILESAILKAAGKSSWEEFPEESEEEIVDENGNKKKLYIVSKSSPYLTKLFNDIESWVNKD